MKFVTDMSDSQETTIPLFDPETMQMQTITLPDGKEIPFTFRNQKGSIHGWAYVRKSIFDFSILIHPVVIAFLLINLSIFALLQSVLMVLITGAAVVFFSLMFARQLKRNKTLTGNVFHYWKLIEVRFLEH